jgi:hypothetical protein
MAPALDPRNAGANAARGKGNDVGNAAVVEICVVRAAENKGEGIGGAPLLEPHDTDAVEVKRVVEGNRAPRKRTRLDIY